MKTTHLSTASEQACTAQLFTHVRDAVIMIDPAGIISFWSAGAAETYGRAATDALNRCYLEVLPAPCREVQVRHINRAMDGEESGAEWQTTAPNGKPMWLEGNFRPLTDNDGKRSGCAILLHDVTKWRAAEVARQASDDLLRTITDNIPGAVFQFQIWPNGRREFPFVSRGVDELLEQSGVEMTAALASGNIHVLDEDRAEFWDSLKRSQDTLAPWSTEFRIRAAQTRQLKWVRLRATPTRLADGGTLWNGVMSDVSDRANALAALRESEEVLRSVIAHIPAAVFWKDRHSTYLGCNDLVARHGGLKTAAEIVGKTDLDLGFEPAESAAYRECDRQVMESGKPILNLEEIQTRPEGKAVLLTSKVPLRNEAGCVVGILGIYQDITGRKRLEEHLRRSQKLEAVGRLAGGIAHDFNNLLTVINGFSEMVLRGLDSPDPVRIASQVQEIRKAGERAASLTRQLLAFGKRQVQTRTRVNLNEVIEETRRLLGRVLGEDVEIETELCPDLGPLHVDVGQIEQVLMHLVLNARDAMPDGGTLTIRTRNAIVETPPEEDVPPGNFVVLAVEDTGMGMDEASRIRAFEPFFTTKEFGRGTGLGLATVHGIVKQSNGFIEVYSELQRGTTFKIYLPRPDPIADEPAIRPKESLIQGRETILLVEDDDSVRRVTATMLRTMGYRVVEASSGMDAVRSCRLHQGPIHLLLTDVVMPTMNGREVAERVQAVLPNVRTLFMSGYTENSILTHGLHDRSVALLCKPLSHETLGKKVREVLGSASVG